ncbi:Uu.00g028660.m01.CDS01 [Anthostomella pinea]|uniref:Uu.00g028660.m01.CDS01 n=1 Tax=Anthostomella pinea TaxID=933095 RepID=A0AAI8YCY3_9PEZI|nr:Uu.00g028660.m01.CDS01 [Anthostomella pinea]
MFNAQDNSGFEEFEASIASRYSHIENNFLDLEKMRKLRKDDLAERERLIKAICNYWLFDNPSIRYGPMWYSTWLETTGTFDDDKDIKPEYLKVNTGLALNPPHKYVLRQMLPIWRVTKTSQIFEDHFHRWPQNSKGWHLHQDSFMHPKFMYDIFEMALKHGHQGTSRSKALDRAIESIPNPERIKKVVCIGLGKVFKSTYLAKCHELQVNIHPSHLAQHTAARAIVEILRSKTHQDVQLHAADPAYGRRHEEVLTNLPGVKFNVLNPIYGHH